MKQFVSERDVYIATVSQGEKLPPGPQPPELLNKKLISLVPPVLYDTPKWGRNFGDVVQQPQRTVRPGNTVSATFVSISLARLSSLSEKEKKKGNFLRIIEERQTMRDVAVNCVTLCKDITRRTRA